MSHIQYVTLPVCKPLLQHPLLRSFSLSIPLLALVIVHAAEKEALKPQGNFDSVLLLLSSLETTHRHPDASRPDLTSLSGDRTFTSTRFRRCTVCAGSRPACCASHSNHTQSCVFPGLLYVNSTHSHTLPHTEKHTSTKACTARGKNAIKSHSFSYADAVYTPP